MIYVVIGFRDGHPEVSPEQQDVLRAGQRHPLHRRRSGLRHPPRRRAVDGDLVVTKKRVSAFTGSDLEVVLRGRGIDHLVLSGIATSGVVLSTLRQAADLDYGLTVLADGCLDADPEVHRVLTEKVFPRQAEVTTIDTWSTT